MTCCFKRLAAFVKGVNCFQMKSYLRDLTLFPVAEIIHQDSACYQSM